MDEDSGILKVPKSKDGHYLAIGTTVKPRRGTYKFESGTVSGYGAVGGSMCVWVCDIKGGSVDEMWCEPKKLIVDFVTVHGLLRDYVAANMENDVKTMREIELKLEVKEGVV